MGILNIYTAVSRKTEEDKSGAGAYGCVLYYVNAQGKEFCKELCAGYETCSSNRLAMHAAIAALEQLNRPCRIMIYTPSKYLTDAFRQNWIDKWLNHNWCREVSGPIRNIDLWEQLLLAIGDHDVEFIYTGEKEESKALLLRCRELADQALQKKLETDVGAEQ